jgi:phage terminase small subunit
MKQGGVHQRRTRFIKEYLLDQNATRAAIAAGYSEKSASVTGSRLLGDAKVRHEIEQKNAETNKSLDLSAERIKQEIARLCYYDPADYWNPNGTAKSMHEIPEDARRAIGGFEAAELFSGSGEDRAQIGYIKKFKLMDKARALELAARCQKMLVDRVEITADDELLKALDAGRKRAASR